jgi:hypothetical protein
MYQELQGRDLESKASDEEEPAEVWQTYVETP